MSINSIQSNSLAALYANTAGLPAGTGENGLFSDMLRQEMLQNASQGASEALSASEGEENTAAGKSGDAALATLLPLLLAGGLSGDSTGSMTMALLMALSGAGGAEESGGLSALFGGDGAGMFSSLLGGGLFSNNAAASAGSQAGMMAATSLVKAFSKAETSSDSLLSGNNLSSIRGWRGASTPANKTYGGSKLSSGAIVPVSASTPTTPAVTSSLQNRSPERYRAVIEQFQVDSAGRYMVNKRGNNDTYCNIFLWDVTSAMGAEIPHYTNWETGAPMTYEQIDQAKQMNANRISDWLNQYGPKYGWYEVTPAQAQQLANEGRPAVTVWKNPTGGHGHVQVVSPSQSGGYDPARGVAIAQAGRNLTDYTYITNIYSDRLKTVQYFAHA